MDTESWTEEEIAIARNAVSAHRAEVARESYRNARKEYHQQIEVGDWIEFQDPNAWYEKVVSGTVTNKGSEAGWALVNGVPTRFDYMSTVQAWREGEAV